MGRELDNWREDIGVMRVDIAWLVIIGTELFNT